MWSPFDYGIDAAVAWPNGKVYFFKGDQYLRFDIGTDRVDQDPRLIVGSWPGWPAGWTDGIQGAFVWGQAAYFFRGSEYIRYDVAADRVSDGYPKRIADYWLGWPADWQDGFDGCVGWPGGLVYFFKGNKFIRYDLNQGKVTRAPTEIYSAWGNWPYSASSRMNGGAVWPNGNAYLFSGSTYVRYSVAADAAVGDVAPIVENWIGWPGYDFIKVRAGTYYFKSKAHNKYLCREADHYIVNRSAAGEWERFTVTVADAGYHIQDYRGAYMAFALSWTPMGEVPGVKPVPLSGASVFYIEPISSGGYSVRVPHNNGVEETQYYLSAQPSGALETRGAAREWETFLLTKV